MKINNLKMIQAALVTAGWDGVQTDQSPMEIVKEDYPKIEWLMKDRDGIYGIDARDFYVVLYEVKRENGLPWVYTKIMSGNMGPFQRPPEKFWSHPTVQKFMKANPKIEEYKNKDLRV